MKKIIAIRYKDSCHERTTNKAWN